eukprot:11757-Heterococcus_DN1.PRE.1
MKPISFSVVMPVISGAPSFSARFKLISFLATAISVPPGAAPPVCQDSNGLTPGGVPCGCAFTLLHTLHTV